MVILGRTPRSTCSASCWTTATTSRTTRPRRATRTSTATSRLPPPAIGRSLRREHDDVGPARPRRRGPAADRRRRGRGAALAGRRRRTPTAAGASTTTADDATSSGRPDRRRHPGARRRRHRAVERRRRSAASATCAPPRRAPTAASRAYLATRAVERRVDGVGDPGHLRRRSSRPTDAAWLENGTSPLDYLRTLRQPNGSFVHGKGAAERPEQR